MTTNELEILNKHGIYYDEDINMRQGIFDMLNPHVFIPTDFMSMCSIMISHREKTHYFSGGMNHDSKKKYTFLIIFFLKIRRFLKNICIYI